jgi:hypothetical protein
VKVNIHTHAALLAVTTLACNDSAGPTSVSVRATLESAQVRIGTPVRVVVDVENTGSRAVSINGGDAIAFLEVRNSAGTVVFFGRSGPFDPTTRTTLDVGERVSDTPVWSGEPVGRNVSTAQPGTYRVRAFVPVGSRGNYVFSDPLEVTLVQ